MDIALVLMLIAFIGPISYMIYIGFRENRSGRQDGDRKKDQG